jgi:hypothetical protein
VTVWLLVTRRQHTIKIQHIAVRTTEDVQRVGYYGRRDNTCLIPKSQLDQGRDGGLPRHLWIVQPVGFAHPWVSNKPGEWVEESNEAVR